MFLIKIIYRKNVKGANAKYEYTKSTNPKYKKSTTRFLEYEKSLNPKYEKNTNLKYVTWEVQKSTKKVRI